ncbi:uncharacterized protein LOC127881128 isoform X1 [Dreissena polymorpha]|uniref:uncharacterized protein LOC127881128 isoform X1 n=1 Tax=Dreissena polymorpha TaxID=45954 RepID=UPI0022656887|nr:uncharacterized protein LOC127881128 isoform X1 [Dreissena polymorpha]
MVQCVAFGCKEREENGKNVFFRFAKDDVTCKKWIKAVNSRRVIDGRLVDFKPKAYKASKKAPLNPNDLGPGKHNRAKYGAYSERNRTHIHHVWKSQMSVKKCLVNSRLFGSVILNHILIMCIRSHHRHLRRLYFGQQNIRDSLSNHRERTLLS